MRWMRWLIAFVATAMLLASMGTSAHAGDPDLSWPPSLGGNVDAGQASIGFLIHDKFSFESSINTRAPGWHPPCNSMDDPVCADPAREYGWAIARAAPPCSVALAWEECVEGLTVTMQGSTEESRFLRLAPGKRTFPADLKHGLPTGSALGLWSDPSSADGTTGYAIELSGQMGGHEGSFHFGTFSAQVTRYRIGEASQVHGCLWFEENKCGYRIAFPDDVRLRLAFRMADTLSGWLSGRLSTPTVEVSRSASGLNRVVVEAAPVDLPMAAASIPAAEVTDDISKYWNDTFRCGDSSPCSGVMVESDGPHSANLLSVFAPFLNDRAIRVLPTWSVASLNGLPPGCPIAQDTLVGLVTTNATVYSSGPPALTDGALRYSVAALHLMPDGETFHGSYDLLVRSDYARCLYGLSNAPITASIEVTSEDGTEQVATTAVSESNGWLRLSATGFHFSQPTIAVTLKSSAPAKKTIMCKKGKKTKRVTGIKPVCPTGWKKVRP